MEIDDLDRAVVHALRIDGRAGWREIGTVLGVSDQTVARRYRRLRETAGVRVVGLINPIRLGYETWMLRLHTRPDTAAPLAGALARRPDTTWVSLFSGGTEVSCSVRVAAHADREALLLQKLPRTPNLVSVSAHCLIHHYVGGAVGPDRRDDALTADQIAALTPPESAGDPAPITDGDGPLLDALARDGRAGYTELAGATGRPESTVRRRMRELRGSGTLYYDVEVNPPVFGFRAPVLLWMTVSPARLAAVGAALTEHEEVVFAAATTGATNLVATVICRDMAAFYRYLTARVNGLDGVDRVESAPLSRHVKQLGAVPGQGRSTRTGSPRTSSS